VTARLPTLPGHPLAELASFETAMAIRITRPRLAIGLHDPVPPEHRGRQTEPAAHRRQPVIIPEEPKWLTRSPSEGGSRR
jgi:hypothetical protein